MGTWVQWFGFGVRQAHGLTWENGTAHLIEDETVALDLLTQPGERFEVVDSPGPPSIHPSVASGGEAIQLQLTEVEGIGPKRAAELAGAGIGSVAALAGLLGDYVALRATLEQLTGVSEATLLNWSRAAGDLLAEE